MVKSSRQAAARLIYSLPADRITFRCINSLENIVLSLILVAMIVLACTQIFLRTFLSSGVLWADPVLRYLVLWSGLLGAVAATGQGKHIALDIFSRKIPKAVAPWFSLVTHIFSCLVSAGLTWAGILFLKAELEFGSAGPLSQPLWFWNSIFPVAFCLMSVKYLFLSYLQLQQILKMKNV